jgi:4-hydroxy-tetrahydrodipicolinate synthase
VRLAAFDRTASRDFPAGYKRAAAERFGTSAATRVGV